MRQTPGAQRPPRALSSQRSPARGPAGTRHHAQGAGHPLHPQNGGWGGGDPLFIPPPSAPERLYPQLHCRGNHLPSPWQLTQSPPPPPSIPSPTSWHPHTRVSRGGWGCPGVPRAGGGCPQCHQSPSDRGVSRLPAPGQPWWGADGRTTVVGTGCPCTPGCPPGSAATSVPVPPPTSCRDLTGVEGQRGQGTRHGG